MPRLSSSIAVLCGVVAAASAWLPWDVTEDEATATGCVVTTSGFGFGHRGPLVLTLAAAGVVAAVVSALARSPRLRVGAASLAFCAMASATLATLENLVRQVDGIEQTCGLCTQWPGVGIYLALASSFAGTVAASTRLTEACRREPTA